MDYINQNSNFPIVSSVSYVNSFVDHFLWLPNPWRNSSLLFLCALGLESGLSFLHQIQNQIIMASIWCCSNHEHFSFNFCFWLWHFSYFLVSSIWTVSFLVNMALVFKRFKRFKWLKIISILRSRKCKLEELERGFEGVSTLA